MRVHQSTLGKTKYHYTYHSDLSGHVEITRTNTSGEAKMFIPGDDLIAIVAEIMANRLRSKLDSMSDIEIMEASYDV